MLQMRPIHLFIETQAAMEAAFATTNHPSCDVVNWQSRRSCLTVFGAMGQISVFRPGFYCNTPAMMSEYSPCPA
jgi:hypothetical protein